MYEDGIDVPALDAIQLETETERFIWTIFVSVYPDISNGAGVMQTLLAYFTLNGFRQSDRLSFYTEVIRRALPKRDKGSGRKPPISKSGPVRGRNRR